MSDIIFTLNKSNKPAGKSVPDADAFDVLGDYLAKAGKTGPGSRGGKVIRILGNGKAVYQTKAGTDDAYAHFGHQDHVEAQAAHNDEIEKHRAKAAAPDSTPDEQKRAKAAITRHVHNASRHRLMAEVLEQNHKSSRAYATEAEHAALGQPDENGLLQATADYRSHQAKQAEAAYHGSAQPQPVTKSEHTQGHDMEACGILDGYLSKGGEGSRGGKVIGYTKTSHHPVYANTHGTTEHYAHFTAKDHTEAADVHDARAKKIKNRKEQITSEKNSATHWFAAGRAEKPGKAHKSTSTEHTMQASDIIADYLSKGGEGSRGGKIIGHTAHGPVYAKHDASHESYKHFTPSDHKQAAKMLEKRSKETKSLTEQSNAYSRGQGHLSVADHKESGNSHESYKSMDAADWTASDVINDYLSKGGGEGSRGGKVIGHSGGRPIYASSKKTTGGHSTDEHGIHDSAAIGKTKSGANIPHANHPAYSLEYGIRSEPEAEETHRNAKRVKEAFPHFSADDHKIAARKHEAESLKDFREGRDGQSDKGNAAGLAHGHIVKQSKANALSEAANAHKPQNERENKAAERAHNKAAEAHYDLGTSEGERHGRSHRDAANYYEDRKGQYHKSMPDENDFAKSDWTACDVLDNYLSKGGEGSRGGHIIDHSNGKPIYSHDHKANAKVKVLGDRNGTGVQDVVQSTMRAHGNYSVKDHENAANAHEANSKKYGDVHSKLAEAHNITSGFMAAVGRKSEQVEDDLHKSDWTACDVLGAYTAGAQLSKAGGAGSRGGKVIGTTASGKPIYAANKQVYGGMNNGADHAEHVKSRYPEYTAQDHADASKTHRDAAEKLDSKPATASSFGTYARHVDAMRGHHAAALKMNAGDHPIPFAAKKSMSAGYGDNGQQFADENNMDPNLIQVRAVDDLNNSALNDSIAAAWPGRPFMGNSAESFCAMANNMNYRTGV